MKKKIISLLLAVVMIVGIIPFSAFADDISETEFLITTTVVNGTISPTKNIPDGDSYTVEYAPKTVTGYVLDSVKVDGTPVSTETYATSYTFTDIKAPHTIEVVFLHIYPVVFDTNGGSRIPPQFVKHGGRVTMPEDPTKTGYTFKGWYADEELTVPFDFYAPITEPTTLYADYTENVYTLHYDANGGVSTSAPEDQEMRISDEARISVIEPVRPGHTFKGWSTDSDAKTAQFLPNGTFKAPGIDKAPDTTLYAVWEDIIVYIYYAAGEGGTVSRTFEIDLLADEDIARVLEGSVAIPNEGYRFDRWKNSKDETVSTSAELIPGRTEDGIFVSESYTAVFVKDEYTVTFDVQGHGTAPDIQTVDNGKKATKPDDPSDVNRVFCGWYKDSDCTEPWDFDNDTVTGYVTLYAKWIYPCTLTLLPTGGTGGTQQVAARYGEALPTITIPTMNGVVFDGYYDINGVKYYNADGTGARNWDKLDDYDTLIAYWTSASSHTHTFADAYSHNDTHHWRVCTCEDDACKGNVTDFGTHTFDEGVVDGNKTTYTCKCGYTKVVYDKPDDEGEIVTGVSYTGISLTLGSDIAINFYMELPDEARQNGTMTFNIGGRIVTLKGTDAKYNSTEKKYYFSTPLTVLEMAETVTATFTYNGVDYVQKYSVADYVDEIVGHPEKYGKEAAALARKIANYGYYVQIYLEGIHTNVHIVDFGDGYDRMDHFGGEFDINTQKAIEALKDYKVSVSGTSDNLSLYGSTVYFDAATTLNYYVTVKNGVKPTATATNTVTGETKQVEIKLYKGNIYIISVKDITATELADDITVAINGEITLTGSVFAYCNSVVSAHSFDGATEKDTFAVNAMAAFYEYYDAAVDYAEDTVTFDNEPYCPSIYQTVKHGEKAHRPTDPMTSSFVFDGWYKDVERTIPWNFDTPITEDTTIYGKWISQEDYQEIVENAKFQVSNLRNNAVSEIESLNLEDGKKQDFIAEVDNVANTAQWQIENAKYTAEIQNIIVEATNKINKVLSNAEHAVEYTVSFDMMGHGEQVSSQPVKQGDKAQIPTTPTADGYQFDGWYLDDTFETPWDFDTSITENTTLYAKWAKLYTVSYIMSGHGTQINSQTVPDGGKVTRPDDPVAEGWLFGGWYKDANLQTVWNFNLDTVTADTTLYAKWTENTPAEAYIYLNTGGSSLWNQENATFAVWTWGGNLTGSKAVTMTKVWGDIYKVKKSDVGTNIKFFRVADGKTFDGSDWSNNTILNQTADLSVPTVTKSMYIITGWDSGYWGVYGA